MKRIKEACLLQTIHFQLKEDLPHGAAVQAVRAEVADYKAQMDRNHTSTRLPGRRSSPTAPSSSISRSSTTTTLAALTWMTDQRRRLRTGFSPAGAALLLFPSWSGGRPGKLEWR